MRPRFVADINLKCAILSGLKRREPAVDFQSGQAAQLDGLNDSDVLAYAATEGRILVSHDTRTMPRHFRTFIAIQESPGVFLISQYLPVGVAIDSLLEIWAASDASEWKNQLKYLPL